MIEIEILTDLSPARVLWALGSAVVCALAVMAGWHATQHLIRLGNTKVRQFTITWLIVWICVLSVGAVDSLLFGSETIGRVCVVTSMWLTLSGAFLAGTLRLRELTRGFFAAHFAFAGWFVVLVWLEQHS